MSTSISVGDQVSGVEVTHKGDGFCCTVREGKLVRIGGIDAIIESKAKKRYVVGKASLRPLGAKNALTESLEERV